MANGPMTGFKGLDLTDEIGFLCGKVLADLGVEMIKVEKPGGDPSRLIPPFYQGKKDPEKSLYWFAYNTNKKGITLDIESKEGKELFKQLVQKVDFVIESFPPGYMKKLGLDYASLAKINPKIIVTSITPFGQEGPFSHLKGSDLIIGSLGVMISGYGDADRAPVRTTVPQTYMHAGINAAEGTMIAHYYRTLTGIGQYVDVSAMESATWASHLDLPAWNATGKVLKRAGGVQSSTGLHAPQIWECKDGFISYYLRGGIYGADSNRKLTEWMDNENIAPDYMKNKVWEEWDWQKTAQPELDIIVAGFQQLFKSHTKDELKEGAMKRDIMLHIVCDSSDTLKNVQLKARDFWVTLDDDALDKQVVYPGPIAKFTESPSTNWYRAPRIGEHNNEIYGGLMGLSSDKIKTLESNKVI
jgi:crotonobetainyl-CoA:carnitine CoA-transferase CaiB-like acyl-CoA transferase